MAITSGQQVNMVQVSTQAKYNDIVSKVPATIYWVAETKKAYLDGVPYGFNNTDINSALLNSLFTFNDTVTLDLTTVETGGKVTVKGDVILAPTDNLMEATASGLKVSTASVGTIISGNITAQVLDTKGAANGIASLDASAKIPTSQLPSYVDDVVSYTNLAGFPATGETGKIYVADDTNKVYRWSGSAYVEISASLALGTTSATAFRGDYGQTAYSHTSLTNNPHSVTKAQVGLTSVMDYGIATTVEAQAGTSSVKYMTPLRVNEAIVALAPKMT